MNFSTTINCMDGRVQLPVIKYLQQRFGAENVDSITAAGPNRILAEQKDEAVIHSLLKRVDISINAHKSPALAVTGHHDCAGNPVGKQEQLEHIRAAVRFLKKRYPQIQIIGLWVNEDWKVEEIETGDV